MGSLANHPCDFSVIQRTAELKSRGLDRLTIRDMLLMSTGVAFQHDNGLFLPLQPFLSDDAKQYYTTNLRQLILSVRRFRLRRLWRVNEE